MRILTEFSKPPQDVGAHTARLIADNGELLARQRRIVKSLQSAPARTSCLLCEAGLAGAPRFRHRDLDYCSCSRCGHVQSVNEPPPGYPYSDQDFADIYRPLDPAAYANRTERIYAPKLDWVLRAAQAMDIPDILGRKWLELGSGAGNFLSALRARGARRIAGVEAEPPLVAQAEKMLQEPLVSLFPGSLAEAVRQHPADVYVAWFVLEHCFELPALLEAMREKPLGTVWIFAVPTYGVATMLETALDAHFARNLDGVLHVQLFTDRSIETAMVRAGHEIRAEWLFGQDADDLLRAVTIHLGSEAAALQPQLDGLARAIPGIQRAIDQARLSDSRHVLAVRA